MYDRLDSTNLGENARRDQTNVRDKSYREEPHPLAITEFREELLAAFDARGFEHLRRHKAEIDEKKRLVHFAFDLFNLATAPNLPYATYLIPGGFTIGGVYLEHRGATASTVGAWIGTRTDLGLPFFDVANGHFKALPLDPKDQIKAITFAITQGSINTSNVVRGILSTEAMGPMQGAT